MHVFPLDQILILLGFSVLSVAVFKQLNLPSVLAYLLVGMLAGHHSFGFIAKSDVIEQIAEIGMVFLLFTIGLEVSMPKLMSMKRIVFGIGFIQVLISTISTIAIGLWLGLGWAASFAVGGALAMSSTAISIKQLNDQHELQSRHGHIALGVLLFQDLAVVPFLVLIPLFAQPEAGSLVPAMMMALLKGAFAFALIYYAGQWLIRPATNWVAASYSSELFTLFILLVSLLAAWLTWELGLSLAMGAFLAGIMLAETEYQHHVQTEIRPFKDVLMGLFFISVGTQFNWHIVVSQPLEVFVLSSGIMFGKGLAIAIITYLFGFERGVAVRSGLVLGQGSEFSFALLALSLSLGLLSLEVSQPIIAAIIFSMALSPMVIRFNGKIAKLIARDYVTNRQTLECHIEKAANNLNQHVLVCGFGRTGQSLSLFFKKLNIKFIALDVDAGLIKEAWDAGEPVYYGDSRHGETLKYAGIYQADAIVVTFGDVNTSKQIIKMVRHLRPKIPLIVRTRDDTHLEELLILGADEVIPDTVESSIMLASHTLGILGVDENDTKIVIDEARSSHYQRILSFFHGKNDRIEKSEHYLHSITLMPNSYAINKSLNMFDFKQCHVKALRRNNIRCEMPDFTAPLKENDIILIEGNDDGIKALELNLLSGY